jgi:hypothetical protein
LPTFTEGYAMRKLMLFVPLCLAISACSGGDGDGKASTAAAANGGSDVPVEYRSSFDRAWKNAEEGRSPTQACAGVFGTAVGSLTTTATEGPARDGALAAMDACYVRAMARFVEVKLSVDNPGTAECISLLRALPVHRSALGGFITDVGEDQAAFDHRLNERIGDKVRSACPDAASAILGT